jgi:glycerol-1-phosphate dehydrogenase [NAD(P)+]
MIPDAAGSAPCTACAGRHESPLEALWLGAGAIGRLGEHLGANGWLRILVVADANTAEVLGDEVASSLGAAGHQVTRLVFPQRHGLLADEAALAEVRAALASAPAEAAVAVGSGTLNDLTRYASFLERRPWCSVPTAASMDGYASGVAAMQFGGVKVSYPARAPSGIFAEPAVVAAAPREMAVWGLGDLLGKASASFDWRLGHGVTGERFCPEIESRVLGPLRRCTEQVEGVLAGDEASLQVLLGGLVESGVAMAMLGSSRPASGAEHHCSHLWDLLAFRGLREHAPHGLQVGYATGFVTQLQAGSLQGLAAPLGLAPGTEVPGEERWLGEGSAALASVRHEKAREFAAYAPCWPPAPAALAELSASLAVPAALFGPVAGALRRAGIPGTPGFLGIDGAALRATLRLANRLRNRFTVLDLLESQGRLEEAIEAL